ncbi:MAG: hypothetical protein ACYDBH_20125 [Acidobacteriaceae bacterium]
MNKQPSSTDISNLQIALCRAGTALDKMKDEQDPMMVDILRDAAHRAVSEGLDVFEFAGG